MQSGTLHARMGADRPTLRSPRFPHETVSCTKDLKEHDSINGMVSRSASRGSRAIPVDLVYAHHHHHTVATTNPRTIPEPALSRLVNTLNLVSNTQAVKKQTRGIETPIVRPSERHTLAREPNGRRCWSRGASNRPMSYNRAMHIIHLQMPTFLIA